MGSPPGISYNPIADTSNSTRVYTRSVYIGQA